MNFVQWLNVQPQGDIRPSQVATAVSFLDLLRTPDLIVVLNHGTDGLAMKAFLLLRDRYEEEQRWIDEMNATREEEDAIDWG